jgi:PAS domain S-box-containing protein
MPSRKLHKTALLSMGAISVASSGQLIQTPAADQAPNPPLQLLDLIHPGARERTQAHLAALRTGQPMPALLGVPLNVPEAQMQWVDLDLRTGDSLHSLAGECRDATTRILEERFQQIAWPSLDLLPSCSVITTAGPAHIILYCNRAFQDITGYAPEEAMGRTFSFLQGKQRDKKSLDGMRRALAKGRGIALVLRNYRKSGQGFWSHIKITPIRDPETEWVTHFWSVQTDVTKQREQMAALSLQSKQLQELFKDSPLGLVSFDQDGRASLVNPAFTRLIPVPVRGLNRAAVLAALAPLRKADETDTIFTGAASGVCHLEIPGRPPRVIQLSTGSHGNSSTFDMLLLRDVTTEKALSALQTQFLSGAAHELRAPLASIRGFSELMLLRESLTADQLTMMEIIMRQSTHMSHLLNDLLDLTRLEAQTAGAQVLAPVKLRGIVQSVVDEQSVLSSKHQIQIQAPDEAIWVMADAAKLHQIVTNLISNAIKYSPDGGAVSLRLLRKPETGQAGLAVRDSGIGMTAETLSKLFQRFFRAAPSGSIGGTGLGLCIVKELVEGAGGSIQVQSQAGQGSEFTVWLSATTELQQA